MSKSSDIITDLFTKLAFHLQTSNGLEGDLAGNSAACALAISSLNESLNHSEIPRARVLETALSLMCFKSCQVSNSTVEYLVETIVAAVSSSISCQSSSRIGSPIEFGDCARLIEASADVIRSLQGCGKPSHKLLRAILRVATSSCYQSEFRLSSVVQEKFNREERSGISSLHSLLPVETSEITNEMPLRLLLWYLDPLALKHDISALLRESVERPFLCLKEELHERMAWRSIIICLVISPIMFIEARALLHNWFLLTGLASVQKLCIELVASVLDVLSRPMWWGMSMNLGIKLPFCQAYFPTVLHILIMKLAEPVSSEGFLELVHHVTASQSRMHSKPVESPPSYGSLSLTAAEATVSARKLIWALLMDFPSWFYFATVLLFCGEDSQPIFLRKSMSIAVETEKKHILHLKHAAARYLAWILSPINEVHWDFMFDCINEVSGSWPPKHNRSDTHLSRTSSSDKMDRGMKFNRPMNDYSHTKRFNGSLGIGPWLEDFDACYTKYYRKMVVGYETETTQIRMVQPKLLFRRIPLGIMIGCSNYLDEKGCELLFEYATTGKIGAYAETRNASKQHVKQRSRGQGYEYLEKWQEVRNEMNGSIDGASLVFNLFDVIGNISASVFDSKESERDFVSQVKGKAGKYLVKCVKKLLEHEINADEGRVVMLTDLSRRLERWREQGHEVFEGHEGFSDVVKDLSVKISSY